MALQALEVVLNQVLATLKLGRSQQTDLLTLLQQLQALFAGYIICLACEHGATEPAPAYAEIVLKALQTVADLTPIQFLSPFSVVSNNVTFNGIDTFTIEVPGTYFLLVL
ncbi:hypothetical protein ACQUW6_32065 [Bacillus thuringiensis]|uniref:hypothetical protein n=1 Tax=Bacillus thuringiensis TaxID=1428 RepID=UPI003D0EF716